MKATESDWMESVYDHNAYFKYSHDPDFRLSSSRIESYASHWTKSCPKVKRSKRRKQKMRAKRIERNKFYKR